jgi:small subunit ribosomal protein S10
MSSKSTKERLTLLKSVHIYKKHRVQYEVRTHRASLELNHLTGSTADTYLEYVQRCLPEGISMKVTRVSIYFNHFILIPVVNTVYPLISA